MMNKYDKATLKEFLDDIFCTLLNIDEDERIDVDYLLDVERDEFGSIKRIEFSSILSKGNN